MPKICPVLVFNGQRLTKDGETETFDVRIKCLKEKCAWWNDDFGGCAIEALATVATRPVVLKERLGDA